jgi:hypothetical protein
LTSSVTVCCALCPSLPMKHRDSATMISSSLFRSSMFTP